MRYVAVARVGACPAVYRQRRQHGNRPPVWFDVGKENPSRQRWRTRRKQSIHVAQRADSRYLASGTVFTVFLATLNNGADQNGPGGVDSPITGCFANHCDWRLPSVVELKSIRAAGCATGKNLPCIDPAFGPTQADTYWSATTHIDNTRVTRNVNFGDGSNQLLPKTDGAYVRAVRSDCQSIIR
jgi:hypothetical protein